MLFDMEKIRGKVILVQRNFCKNVLALVEERNITRMEVANQAGVSLSFFSDLTNNKANPSLRVMEAIAGALAVPLPMLLRNANVVLKDQTKALEGTYILTEFQAYTATKWHVQNLRKAKGTQR